MSSIHFRQYIRHYFETCVTGFLMAPNAHKAKYPTQCETSHIHTVYTYIHVYSAGDQTLDLDFSKPKTVC